MPGLCRVLLATVEVLQFGYFGFGGRRTLPSVNPMIPNAQSSPRVRVWFVRSAFSAAAHWSTNAGKFLTSVVLGIGVVGVSRVTAAGKLPRKTKSLGTVTMLELQSPVFHSPKAIVLLVPSPTLRMPMAALPFVPAYW